MYRILKTSRKVTWSKMVNYLTTSTDTNGHLVTPKIIHNILIEHKMKMETGFACIITQCPKLSRIKKIDKNDAMYINTKSGHFVCRHCNKQGTWQDLADNLFQVNQVKRKSVHTCFSSVENIKVYLEESNPAKVLLSGARPVKEVQPQVIQSLLETFNMQEINGETLDKFNVLCNPVTKSFLFPIWTENVLVGVKKLTYHDMGMEVAGVLKETQTPRLGTSGVFGFNLINPSTAEIVFTGSEADAMAVHQETKKLAIALPKSFSGLPQELLPSLEQFSSIVLWFGDDIRAWEQAKIFANKLNSCRCHVIRPSSEEPGPYEALTRGLKLSSILSKAQPVMHKSIVSFSNLRQEVLSEFMYSDQVAGVKWKRYVAMNKLLKGHRRGEFTVFTGPTGSGKTTFISDYSLDLCMQGVHTLWGSFEINNVRLCKMMMQQFALKNFSKNLDLYEHYADQFQSLPLYFMTFHGEETLKRVIDAMSHAVYVHDIGHVVLDNLQFMMGTGGVNEWGERFLKQDATIAAFRKFATNLNCHVTIVIHPRKEKDTDELTTSSVFGTAKATQEADNVMILQDRHLNFKRDRKYIQVTKNRFDGELGVMLLKFDKESLTFFPKEKPVKKQQTSDNKQEALDSNTSTEQLIDSSSNSHQLNDSNTSPQEKDSPSGRHEGNLSTNTYEGYLSTKEIDEEMVDYQEDKV